ncbi:Uncharacterised protein [uncultured archaeon]|nr:Uncharacterised protein [uncultured archaeon]
MSTLHSLRKKINKSSPKLIFPPDMYNNIYGSAAICCYILSPGYAKPNISQLSKKWRDIKAGKISIDKIDFEKDSCIDDCLSLYGLSRPGYFPIALVISAYNMLFAPFIDDVVLPLREDGWKGITLTSGKVYPIDFTKNKTDKKPDSGN